MRMLLNTCLIGLGAIALALIIGFAWLFFARILLLQHQELLRSDRRLHLHEFAQEGAQQPPILVQRGHQRVRDPVFRLRILIEGVAQCRPEKLLRRNILRQWRSS